MDMYVAEDGLAGDFHLVHLGGKALGGAGLVMTEMVCVSPDGPDHAGLRRPLGRRAAGRVARGSPTSCTPRHRRRSASSSATRARKGSTKLMWEGIDEPLPDGNWEVVAASPVPYRPAVNQVPRELTVDELDEIRDQFVGCARRGAEAGFDLLELHCAHGYLLSASSRRSRTGAPTRTAATSRGGCATRSRCSAPCASVWPAERPMTVRISATDWVDDGSDARRRASGWRRRSRTRALRRSTCRPGRSPPRERPAFGRSYQTPYADAIRNRTASRRSRSA